MRSLCAFGLVASLAIVAVVGCNSSNFICAQRKSEAANAVIAAETRVEANLKLEGLLGLRSCVERRSL